MSNNTKHTPGPWYVYDDEYPVINTTFDDEKYDIATIPADGLPQVQVQANARLIAAAPELLAQLVDCRALIHAYGGDYLDMRTTKKKLAELDTVITKATTNS